MMETMFGKYKYKTLSAALVSLAPNHLEHHGALLLRQKELAIRPANRMVVQVNGQVLRDIVFGRVKRLRFPSLLAVHVDEGSDAILLRFAVVVREQDQIVGSLEFNLFPYNP